MPRRLRLLLAAPAFGALLAGVTAVTGPAAAAAGAPVPTVADAAGPRAAAVPGPVVLVGTGGLRWDGVDSGTPVLSALLSGGSVGAMVVRSVRLAACPVDGWLAVSAGRRAADAPPDAGGPPCRLVQPAVTGTGGRGTDGTAADGTGGGPATVPRWDVYRARAAEDAFDASPGALGDLLARAGLRAAAVGPGAAVAVADGQGRVTTAWPGAAPGPGGTVDPGSGERELGEQVQQALSTDPDLLVVDVGAVRAPPPDAPADAPSVQDQVEAVDSRVGTVLGALPEQATVVLASLADADGTPSLQLAVAYGPSGSGEPFRGGYLRSTSTRQVGLVQSTDVLPTLLSALGVAVPAQVAGAPMTATEPGTPDVDRLQHLRDLAGAAETIDPLVAPFFVVLAALQLLLYAGAAAIVGRAGRRRQAGVTGGAGDPVRRGILRATWRAAVVLSLVPAATFLANLWPWWRSQHPGVVLTVAVASWTVPLGLLAVLGPWRRALLGPAGVAAGLTALVLLLDVATGSRLSLTTLMGGQPLVAGRFYGFSNPGFALFGTGALLAAVALADVLLRRDRRRAAVAAVAVLGAVATVVDVLPGLGSDFGGPPALVPAFAYFALRVAGVGLTWRRAVLVAVVTAAVLAAACLLDWLRPAQDRTHLGRFVQSLLDGDAWGIVARKLEQNLAILTSSPATMLLPLAIAVVVVVLARPDRWHVPALQAAYDASPVLRPGLAALGVLLLVGFVLNDSGTAIPPVAATVALPLLVAVSAAALERREPAPDPRPRPGPSRSRQIAR